MHRSDWHQACVRPETPLRDVLAAMNDEGWRIALVCDPQDRLLGVITDGDVRRGLLRHVDLDAPAETVMNSQPIVAPAAMSREARLQLMLSHSIERLPLVDTERRVVGIDMLRDMLQPPPKDNAVVLMAGGFGTRLRPLTNHCPKPLLKVGEKPILEHILEAFIKHGFRRFFISVHYKAEMIKAHFGDGRRWGVQVEYLEEEEPLGTGGCLTLLPPSALTAPVLVMNGDILTQVDFSALLDFHQCEQVLATLCVREYEYQIPYGVVRIDDHRLKHIEEKPLMRHFVNAGIYVFEPEVISQIPSVPVDIPALLAELQQAQQPVGVFPLHEYWLDIGLIDDFEKAQQDISQL